VRAPRYSNPFSGLITLGYETFTVNANPGQTMFVFRAEPGSGDEHSLLLLAEIAAGNQSRATEGGSSDAVLWRPRRFQRAAVGRLVSAARLGVLDELDADGRTRHGEVNERVAQVGTLRTFRTGSVVATERVTGLEPLRRMDYEGVENPQLRDYQASIELDQTPAGGTAVRWPVR
jgi:hypothetical protein